MKRWLLPLALVVAPSTSFAGKCDVHAAKAGKATGEELVSAYAAMLKCDKGEGEAAFSDFMRGVEDTETLVGLAHAAIDAQSYISVWGMLDEVPDYSQRDDIAKAVGEGCPDHPGVVPFLQGAYFGLKNTQFGKWDKALVTCKNEDLGTFIKTTAASPPQTTYDEKYNTLLKALVHRDGPVALPVLQRAAVEAATNGGPFNAIIEKMNDAVQPAELGADIPPEDRKALEESLVQIAGAVAPEQAALVADRLYNAGAEQAAASLLPNIYPDRVQDDGSLLYGAASIEHCEGEAYIHWSTVTEPAKRWSVLGAVEEPARQFKQKLKCATEGDWPVISTNEPVASESDLYTWVTDVQRQWESKGNKVKAKQEKGITLD